MPAASRTMKYWPGCSVMLPGIVVTCQVVPAADAYCTDQPPMFTGALPLLKSSMKSC